MILTIILALCFGYYCYVVDYKGEENGNNENRDNEVNGRTN